MAREEDDLTVDIKSKDDLETLSIEELQDYITELKSQIEKVEQHINKKKIAEVAANSIFKS
ncbi:MAG: DUF1192 domain-containing protein [Sneathiella sp.]